MSQVDKLEALLERVQRNRRSAPERGGAPAPAASGSAAPTPQRAPRPSPPAPVVAPAAPRPSRPRPKSGPTPLELAVEGQLQKPSSRPPAAEPGPRTEPSPPASSPPAAAAPAASPAPSVGTPVKPDSVAPPSAPIVQTTGRAAQAGPATFGALLDRTLRLRPRG